MALPDNPGLILTEADKLIAVDDIVAASTQDLAAVLAEGNDADGASIANLADPSDDQDAATKKYVDENSGAGSVPGAGTSRGPFVVTSDAVHAAWDTDHADVDLVDLVDGNFVQEGYGNTPGQWDAGSGYCYLDAFGDGSGPAEQCTIGISTYADDATALALAVSSFQPAFIVQGSRTLGLRFFQDPGAAAGQTLKVFFVIADEVVAP